MRQEEKKKMTKKEKTKVWCLFFKAQWKNELRIK